MRSLTVLVAVTSFLTAAPSAHADTLTPPPAHSAVADWAYVSTTVWRTPLPEFLRRRSHHTPWADTFDWTTDGCSTPGHVESGRFYNFHDACIRHDFGYRNLQLLDTRFGPAHRYWNETNRKRVDQQFLADMNASCSKRSWFVRPVCRLWARVYYLGVRTFGGSYAPLNPSA
jgi:hypothetical protein